MNTRISLVYASGFQKAQLQKMRVGSGRSGIKRLDSPSLRRRLTTDNRAVGGFRAILYSSCFQDLPA